MSPVQPTISAAGLAEIVRKSAGALLVVALCLPVTACGPKTIQTAAIINGQFAKALVTAQQVVKTAYQNGAGPQSDYLGVWSPRFEQIGRIGYAATTAIEKGNNQVAIVQVAAALDVVDTLIAVDIPRLSANQQMIVLLAVNTLKGVLLSMASALGEPVPEPVLTMEVELAYQ